MTLALEFVEISAQINNLGAVLILLLSVSGSTKQDLQANVTRDAIHAKPSGVVSCN
jgi:hypothetical protein